MADERCFNLVCPHCKHTISVSEVFPKDFSLSFFAEFKVVDGKFKNIKTYPSITNQYRFTKNKNKQQKIEFKEKEEIKTIF